MITAVYCTSLPVDYVMNDLCTWVELLNNPSIKYSFPTFFVAICSDWLLWGMLLVLCLCCDCRECVVSDGTGDGRSKMFCCILTVESGWCGAHITVFWCWPWSAECRKPKCCRYGDFWADVTNLWWGTFTCNHKFWVSLLDVGDGAVSVSKWWLMLWMGFRVCVVCCGVF
jgi:hypothetical protein